MIGVYIHAEDEQSARAYIFTENKIHPISCKRHVVHASSSMGWSTYQTHILTSSFLSCHPPWWEWVCPTVDGSMHAWVMYILSLVVLTAGHVPVAA